jgi:hypothetical protein
LRWEFVTEYEKCRFCNSIDLFLCHIQGEAIILGCLNETLKNKGKLLNLMPGLNTQKKTPNSKETPLLIDLKA